MTPATKGIPGGTPPFPLRELRSKSWNIVRQDLPFPLMTLKQSAMDQGYNAVINVRLETSRLANSNGGGTAGVEMLAFGTAVRFEQDS